MNLLVDQRSNSLGIDPTDVPVLIQNIATLLTEYSELPNIKSDTNNDNETISTLGFTISNHYMAQLFSIIDEDNDKVTDQDYQYIEKLVHLMKGSEKLLYLISILSSINIKYGNAGFRISRSNVGTKNLQVFVSDLSTHDLVNFHKSFINTLDSLLWFGSIDVFYPGLKSIIETEMDINISSPDIVQYTEHDIDRIV